jgi:hypothetical protein
MVIIQSFLELMFMTDWVHIATKKQYKWVAMGLTENETL